MNFLKRFLWPVPIPLPPKLTPEPFIVTPDSIKPQPVYIRSKRKCEKYIHAKIGNFSVNNANLKKFSSHPIVMTLFYLYLFKKYKSECILIADEYYYRMGLVIYMEDFYKVLNLGYYEKVSATLVNCIRGGSNIIILPVYLIFTTGIDGNAHANVLIYRKLNNVIEHFEPHGSQFLGGYEKEREFIKREIGEFIRIFNIHLNMNHLHEIQLIESSKVCPYTRGLQGLECSVKDKQETIGGYCAAWSMFFSELALANPGLSSNEIIDIVYKKAGKLAGGQYLKDIIEGYANHISDKLDKYYSILFNKIMTTVEIQCRIDAATDAEKIIIYDEFRTIVNLEIELFINNISITEKIKALKKLAAETAATKETKEGLNKKIGILEKLKILEKVTPHGISFRPSSATSLSIHSSTKKAKKKTCPEGQYLNIKTNRCNKDKPTKSETNNVTQKKCPEGQHLNIKTNRCNKDKKTKSETNNVTQKKCPEGQHLNIKTNRCNKDKKKKDS